MSASEENDSFIKVHDVYKSFGAVPVLRGVSMEIAKGEVVCIIGPSGSGKSTILRCINALTPTDQGFIQVGEIQVTSKKLDMVALLHKVGMVFQQYNLFPHKTMLQNISMAPIQVLKQNRKDVEERARSGGIERRRSRDPRHGWARRDRTLSGRALARATGTGGVHGCDDPIRDTG